MEKVDIKLILYICLGVFVIRYIIYPFIRAMSPNYEPPSLQEFTVPKREIPWWAVNHKGDDM
jgi:hypothetical protein